MKLNKKQWIALILGAIVLMLFVGAAKPFVIGNTGAQDVDMFVEQYVENGVNKAQVTVTAFPQYSERTTSGTSFNYIVFKNTDVILENLVRSSQERAPTKAVSNVEIAEGDVFTLYAQRIDNYAMYYQTCSIPCGAPGCGCDPATGRSCRTDCTEQLVHNWNDYVICSTNGQQQVEGYTRPPCQPGWFNLQSTIHFKEPSVVQVPTTQIVPVETIKEIQITAEGQPIFITKSISEYLHDYFANIWLRIKNLFGR